MTAIELVLPPDASVKGQLFYSYEPAYLLQDILEIDLSTGITIDVGWSPECDPSGSFRIVVFRDFWRNQLREPIHVKRISEVVETVQQLAFEYSRPTVVVSCSSESVVPWVTGERSKVDLVSAA
jgi:hypothetical protein